VNGVDLTRTPFLFTPKRAYNLSAVYTLATQIGNLRGQVD
jgi:hypothetical protein